MCGCVSLEMFKNIGSLLKCSPCSLFTGQKRLPLCSIFYGHGFGVLCDSLAGEYLLRSHPHMFSRGLADTWENPGKFDEGSQRSRSAPCSGRRETPPSICPFTDVGKHSRQTPTTERPNTGEHGVLFFVPFLVILIIPHRSDTHDSKFLTVTISRVWEGDWSRSYESLFSSMVHGHRQNATMLITVLMEMLGG